jgi:hypothetical protein
MKQFDLTVTIRVTVDEAPFDIQLTEAQHIADAYAKMATHYKSIGADEVVDITVKETTNV